MDEHLLKALTEGINPDWDGSSPIAENPIDEAMLDTTRPLEDRLRESIAKDIPVAVRRLMEEAFRPRGHGD